MVQGLCSLADAIAVHQLAVAASLSTILLVAFVDGYCSCAPHSPDAIVVHQLAVSASLSATYCCCLNLILACLRLVQFS
ncbi:hypothetical protein U1Q18_033736 [Sarracenia purpurea var. burkii]